MNKYINGDCLEILDRLFINGERFNCLITDPPYGIEHKSNRSTNTNSVTKKGILNDGSDNTELLTNVIEKVDKILLNNSHIYWFTRWDRIYLHYPILAKYFNIKNIIIWDKKNHGSGDLFGSYGNRYECIIFCQKGRRLLNEVDGKKRHEDILSIPKIPSNQLIHPHQKPIELLSFFIDKSTNIGEKIIDPFGGVGSIIVAGANKKRDIYAVELDDFYYTEGKKFLNNKGIDFIEEI